MKIFLFGVPISITSKPQALALVGEWLREWRENKEEGKRQKAKGHSPSSFFLHPFSLSPKVIFTPNPEIIVSAQSDPELMEALQEADLSIPDGVGVVWALRLLQPPSSFFLLPSSFSRLSGLDLMESLISELPRTLLQGLSSKESPWKVMLLGGRPGVAQKVKRHCGAPSDGAVAIPTITAISGPQNIENISKSENDRLIVQINSFSPDLLFVAFGHPRQEKWLIENRERLTAGVAMAVGGALDQIADPSLRPPPYINSIGLGWLYRLLRQPWRIKRQLALVKFVGMVILSRIRR